MKVLVTGSRDWKNRAAIKRELCKLPPGSTIVHGDCETGSDALTDAVARELGFTVRKYPADWDAAAVRGNRNSAGPIRNSVMIRSEHPDKEGKPIDFGLAFTEDFDRSRGTRDCTLKARKAGIRVDVFST